LTVTNPNDMTRFKFITIRIFLFLVLLTVLNYKTNAQIIGPDLFEIIDLYVEEHYDVVLSKLLNMGFEVKQSTPDYTSNKVDYKGDFMMIQPFPCFNNIPPEYKEIRNSYIKFGSQNRPSEKSIQIEFDVVMPLAQNVFQSKVKQWEKEIGPGKLYSDDIGRSVAVFKDTNTYYGKDAEDPSLLVIINYRSSFEIKYYKSDPNVLCNKGYATLEGTIYYHIPKYPVENPHDYFNNLETNKSLLTVPVKKQGNTYSVEITMGGKNFVYIIDSGASEMFISNSTEEYLLELGIIRNSDYLPSKTFRLADGSEKNYRRVKIPLIKIGTIKVEDVEAAIADNNSPMLLGKSFLDKFKYWKINNANQTIELQY
jgi:clan AA aspartic protease (TIGR02281 family)